MSVGHASEEFLAEVRADADEETCRELALASEKAQRAMDGRELAQVIVRAPRLVNLVTSR